MIDPVQLISALSECDVTFATGVPDSLLKDVCACLIERLPSERHIIAANEGSAVGLAIGNFLATGRPALVYLQNSGLGNLINPLASLADPLVYGIPVLLMIGWRGEMQPDGTQLHDEPQHVKQGQITTGLLETLGIPYRILDAASSDIKLIIAELVAHALERAGPVALLVRKNAFSPFVFPPSPDNQSLPTREKAIDLIISALPENTPVVSTTGMASRELFELRRKNKGTHNNDFLTVGGMGHASQIAAGIAQALPRKKVVCLDGDGAMLMHMGGLVTSAMQSNMLHIVINNGAHDSVGGQATPLGQLNLAEIARHCGYALVAQAASTEEILNKLHDAYNAKGSAFIEIRCKRGARPDLGRPDSSPQANKISFMASLQEICA